MTDMSQVANSLASYTKDDDNNVTSALFAIATSLNRIAEELHHLTDFPISVELSGSLSTLTTLETSEPLKVHAENFVHNE